MKTAIVGLGLMGGSMALALRDRNLSDEIWGVDNSASNAEKALSSGLVEKIVTIDEAIVWCDLIVIATPVDSIPAIAIKILDHITGMQIAIDMGSTKEKLCEMISQHPARSRFVATHPMWGTEFSGPEAAVHGAFEGCTVVICEKERSAPEAAKRVEDIYHTLGMTIKYMTAAEQDIHCAYVSHISHVTSFALALTVLEKEREEDNIFDLAGGGFESTVRLAKSSPATWAPIFMQNKYNVLDVLQEHIHQLQILRRMIQRDDHDGLISAMEKANTIKRILK